jgi:hypothetical protein
VCVKHTPRRAGGQPIEEEEEQRETHTHERESAFLRTRRVLDSLPAAGVMCRRVVG